MQTRRAHRCTTQDESSVSQVCTPKLGVNPTENVPVADNVNQEPEEPITEDVNPKPVYDVVS